MPEIPVQQHYGAGLSPAYSPLVCHRRNPLSAIHFLRGIFINVPIQGHYGETFGSGSLTGLPRKCSVRGSLRDTNTYLVKFASSTSGRYLRIRRRKVVARSYLICYNQPLVDLSKAKYICKRKSRMKAFSSNRGNAFLISLFTSLLVSLIVCVFFNVFGPDLMEKFFSQTSEVPNLVGMSLGEAKNALALKKLLVTPQGEANDAKIPKGSVISQNPSAGLKVKKASNISVVLSNGKTAVPKLAHLFLADAKTKITESGLTSGGVLEAESTQVPGAVVSSNPEETKEVQQGTAVSLVVSKGVGMVRVPKIVGRHSTAAKKTLVSAGLVLGNVKETTSEYYQFDIVLDQNPKEGAKAAKGSAVNITLNVEAHEEQ